MGKKKYDYKKFIKASKSDKPKKHFKNFKDYARVARTSTKPSARNSHTEQQIVNRWLLDDSDRRKESEKRGGGGSSGSSWSWDDAARQGSSGGGGGGGGGERTTGINDQGLVDYGEFGSMTPAAFDLFKEIKLRKLDGKNARQLQGIINSGKIEVAAIQRDASIYGSLVSGFW